MGVKVVTTVFVVAMWAIAVTPVREKSVSGCLGRAPSSLWGQSIICGEEVKNVVMDCAA